MKMLKIQFNLINFLMKIELFDFFVKLFELAPCSKMVGNLRGKMFILASFSPPSVSLKLSFLLVLFFHTLCL